MPSERRGPEDLRPDALGPEGPHPRGPGAPPSDLPAPELRDPGVVGPLRAALLSFYDARARALPWREEEDPYRILVSEIMLQQTRVETVVPYYRRWVQRFPEVTSLATAPEEEVLRLWQGLGYYRRARNLQAAAREVVERWGGELPPTVDELRELPGVGTYTAGAVASIAFQEAVPAVDGNVRRVLARVLDDPAPTPSRLGKVAGAWVDPDRPGDFNQALMELGATVCTPRNPRCGTCPLAPWCLARARGTVEERPAPARRRPVPLLLVGVAVVVCGDRVLLRRRPRKGLLGGMWECPGGDLPAAEGAEDTGGDAGTGAGLGGGASSGEPGTPPAPASVREVAQALLPGLALPGGRPLPPVEHIFTHRRIHYRPWLFHLAESVLPRHPEAPPREEPEGGSGDPASTPGAEAAHPLRWVPLDDPSEVPLPRAQERILALAREALAQQA